MDVLDSNRVFPVFLEIKTGISLWGIIKGGEMRKPPVRYLGGQAMAYETEFEL